MSQQRTSMIKSLALPHSADGDDSQASLSGPRPPWWRRRGRIIRISIILLMILLGGFWLFPPSGNPPPSSQLQGITRGNLVLTVRATGSAQAGADNITFPSASTTGTSSIFLQSADPSVLQIVADVNESDIANVKVGDVARFTVSAYGNRIFTGVVSAIAPSGNNVSNVVTFPVYVDVDPNDLQGATLLPGMTANVTIEVARRVNVLLIPVNAVNFAHTASTPSTNPNAPPPLISADQVRVAQSQARQLLMQLQRQNPAVALTDNPTPTFVLEQKNGQLIAKPVVLGLTDGTHYEVLAGLSLGEIIIVGFAGP